MELLPISASLGAMGSLPGKLDGLRDSKLKKEIIKLRTRLLQLSKVRGPSHTARRWMEDVRQLSYDMESCVDTETDWIAKMPRIFKVRVKESNRWYKKYQLERGLSDVFPIIDHRFGTVDGGWKTNPVIVGLQDKGGVFNRLCPLLVDGDEQRKVLSIVGVGGIGKTTLAKQLWRMHKPGDHFSCRAFVRTSKRPDMRRILRSILAQARPHQPPDASDVHELIHDLREHLRNKRYFLIIDDLWSTAVWDVARRAFPEGINGSRILTTTEIKDVALACCSYMPSYIFDMHPLSLGNSKTLFTDGLDEMLTDEIIRRCGGLPLAIISISSVIASQGESNTVQIRKQIENNLATNATPDDILKQVLNFCYNSLPSDLQTCLLYLSLYPENYIILKEDIMMQWVNEGFIVAPRENDKMEVAGKYFDKLVNMGMIQHIDVDYSDEVVDYSDEVLYYAVHRTVHDYISSKSTEENFVTVIDYSQGTVRLSNKVSRLSLQFGSSTYATTPESIRLPHVRSLVFIGLDSCLPPISEFKLLRFLTLHMWSDQPNTGVDLKPTSELVLLRSLQVTCNDTVHLPDLTMQCPKHLETLKINARVAAIPANIVQLRRWLHLRLGVGTELPDLTGILKNVTLNPPISLDESSSPPDSVKTIDLLSPICRIPKWVGQLTSIRILKFVVRELQRDDISNLHGLTFLAVLSLHVQRRTRELIVFEKDAFTALKYFEFRCGVLRLMFQEGTMPNLRRLGLGFNAHRGEQYGRLLVGIEDLLSAQKISVLIGSAPGAEEIDLKAAEFVFKEAIGKHPSIVSVKRVDMVEEYGLPEKQHLLQEKDASREQPGIPNQKFVEDVNKNASRDSQFIQRSNSMDKMAHHEPSKLPYKLLKQITNDFDKDRIIGSGGFGTVYKGVLENRGEIAVKVLHTNPGLDVKEFQKEFDIHRRLKHPNIVELVGFCNESVEELMMFEGKEIMAGRLHMALCFEYVHNGGLNKHISDEKSGLTWHTRYRIIKGICQGLKYLHEGLEYPIMHFDLKPENILVDKSMTPKIIDFGSSRLLGEESGRTASSVGTCGYWPPEYIRHQILSSQFDIFSLGVIIIKIMIGNELYNSILEMPTGKSVKIVHEIWRKQLHGQLSHMSLEIYCNQVKRCIQLALNCLVSNRQERPTIHYIVSSLNETETMISNQGMQTEQFYQDEVSTLPSDVSSTTNNHRPSSENFSDVEPRVMSFSLLHEMTDGFSKHRLLANGARGSVYKGVHRDGHAIAVKMLHTIYRINDKRFQNETAILMKLRHQNIIQFIGYCHETNDLVTQNEGKFVVAEKVHSALCFEYVRYGSLEKYISEDMDSGLDWHTRYGIIKGVCEGLRFLHEGLEKPILHMNLNPTNILMDENMMPKIGGFTYARLVGEGNTRRTTIMMGIGGYMPPEFIDGQVISKEFDIYSLGVTILQLMTGQIPYHELFQMLSQEFIEPAHEKWRRRLQKTVDVTLVEGYCQQVKKCLEIAAKCVENERHKRPPIGAIVQALNKTEILIPQLEIGQPLELESEDSELLLEVHPLVLCFLAAMPLSSLLKVASNKKAAMMSSSCSVQLKNKGTDRVAFMLVANSPKRYRTKEPLCGIVPPRCSYTLTLTMRNYKKQPPLLSSDSGDFLTLYCIQLGPYEFQNVGKDSVFKKYDYFFKNAKEVHEVTLNVVSDRPTADQGTSSSNLPTEPIIEIITTADAQQVSSMDVHPTKPWIMTTNQVGSLCVWDYHTMAALNSIQLVAYGRVHAAKFIAREKSIVAGDCDGGIFVYNYENKEIHSFDAHDSCITTLAVHPTSPFVLSSSEDDNYLIKLWDWGKAWECTREFRGHIDRVTQVTFDIENKDRFASASWDGTIKVWSICSDDPSNIITLKLDRQGESLLCVDYFTRFNRQHLIVGCKDNTAQIWALGIKGSFDILEGHEDYITAVKLHPELPLLMTGSLDGTIRIWDSVTYKPENIIVFNLGAVYAFGCIKGSTTIVVGCHLGIATMKIPFPGRSC